MYHFIVNPKARSGKGIRIWNTVKGLLDEGEVTYEEHITEYAGHARKISRALTTEEATYPPAKIIVVLGGDGTLNEVVDGFCAMEGVVLGYIPTGSSNDFARSLGIPSEPKEALENILQVRADGKKDSFRRVREFNYGIVTNDKGECRRFMVSAGIGFDAAVCHEAVKSRMKDVLNRLGLGKLTYMSIALKQLFGSVLSYGVLKADGGNPIKVKSFLFASAQNHPYEGGGFLFCPNANPSDDVLDGCLVGNMSRIRLLMALPLALKGKHVGLRGVRVLQCREFRVKTLRPLPVHTDGEPFGIMREVGFRLDDRKIKVIV